MYTMTQKSDQYIKMFSILCRVRLMYKILSPLNILYNRRAKPYYAQNNHSLFTYHDHFTCSATYWILLKWSNPQVKTFSTFSVVKNVF